MKLFFRNKENGASVFRLEEDNRHQRSNLVPIAEVNVRNGKIKVRSGTALTAGEATEIEHWMESRRERDEAREAATPQVAIEAINAAAHWISGQPDPALVDQSVDELLIAMLDLRTAIVRHRSKQTAGDDE